MDFLIVGAGMAGLLAARTLSQRQHSVLVVDKGRSVGGRLATRRLGGGQADTGAQFFTARTELFRQSVDAWEKEGWIYLWSHGWADGAGQPQMDGHPRYAARGGMNALAKSLARPLTVQLAVKITSLSPVRDGWQVLDAEGRIFTARAVLLTPPVPQAVTFVETGRTPLRAADLEILRAIHYAPCLAGLYVLDRPTTLPEPGGLQNLSPQVAWVADNQRKGLSPEASVLTVHASAEFSLAHYRDDEAEVLAALWADVQPWLGPAVVKEQGLKRWRYAQPTATYAERCLVAGGVPPLVFAGDGFGEPRVEGAALSGLAAAEALAGLLR